MRGAYRIVDLPCLEVMSALTEVLANEGLPFAIAGGMGVQALLTAGGLEHLLRRTGDIDVVVAADDASIVRALNVLAASHPGLSVVQNPAAKNARVGRMNVDWINEPSRLRGLEHAWSASIERAHVVRVRRLDIPVQEPEVLLAAKLTGQKIRPQDELDVAGVLQSGTAVDEARLLGCSPDGPSASTRTWPSKTAWLRIERMPWQLRDPVFQRALAATIDGLQGRCALAGVVGVQVHVAATVGIEKLGPPAHAIELVVFGGTPVPESSGGIPVRAVPALGFDASIEAGRREIEIDGTRYPVASPEHILGTMLAAEDLRADARWASFALMRVLEERGIDLEEVRGFLKRGAPIERQTLLAELAYLAA